MQFSLNWDPTVIRLVYIQQKYNGLLGFSVNNNIYAPEDGGILRLLWSDPNGNVGSIPDDQALFTLCFEPVGLPGDKTPIGYTGHPLIAEFLRNSEEVCYQFFGNEIVVADAQELCINVFSCPDSANGTGTVTVQIDGGQSPYQVQLNPLGQTCRGGDRCQWQAKNQKNHSRHQPHSNHPGSGDLSDMQGRFGFDIHSHSRRDGHSVEVCHYVVTHAGHWQPLHWRLASRSNRPRRV